jgi:hypothetical protein
MDRLVVDGLEDDDDLREADDTCATGSNALVGDDPKRRNREISTFIIL